MKLAVAISIILLGLNSAIVGLGTYVSWSENSYSASDGLMDFRMKMADALSSINHAKENGFYLNNERKADGIKANTSSINTSSINSSGINSSNVSAFISNSSEVKPSSFSLPPKSLLSNQSAENKTLAFLSSPASSAGFHFNNQESFNGFQSMQVSKHSFGSSGINDRMVLSGNFDVQKSVSFKE
jgi:hypothetical protein